MPDEGANRRYWRHIGSPYSALKIYLISLLVNRYCGIEDQAQDKSHVKAAQPLTGLRLISSGGNFVGQWNKDKVRSLTDEVNCLVQAEDLSANCSTLVLIKEIFDE